MVILSTKSHKLYTLVTDSYLEKHLTFLEVAMVGVLTLVFIVRVIWLIEYDVYIQSVYIVYEMCTVEL